MGREKDLVNMRFGRLLVTEKSQIKNKWECLCDCGKIKVVLGANLIAGHTKSCGCLRNEISGNTNRIDYTGKEFGDIIVLEYIETRQNKVGNYESWFLCKCSCGNIVEINGSNLHSGTTESCGCLKFQSHIAKKLKKYLSDKYKVKIEYRELRNPETGYYLPYDIYIEYFNCYIEINGEQHYRETSFFDKDNESFISRVKRDNLKRKHAKKYGKYIEIDLRKNKTIEEWILYVEKKLNRY